MALPTLAFEFGGDRRVEHVKANFSATVRPMVTIAISPSQVCTAILARQFLPHNLHAVAL